MLLRMQKEYREDVVDVFKKGKFEIFALTETKLKANGEVKERERGKYNKNAEKCGEMVWIHGGVGGDRMVEMNIPNGCR